MTITQQISLAYKDGGSDKVYHAQIEQTDSGYKVNFQYGKRGSTLTTGTKTEAPVELDKATAIYNKLVKEKTAKGYSEGESGAVFQSKDLQDRVTGIVPQLLNKIENAADYLNDDSYFMQEKEDGHRRLIKIEGDTVTSINKKGLEVLSPECVIAPIKKLGVDITVDGELMGEKYSIFDILFYKGQDVRSMSAKERYELLKSTGLKNIARSYFGTKAKTEAFNLMEPPEMKKEGVVFKKNTSSYVAGRPNSGGNQLKYKFYATDTFEVVSHNTAKGKRSVNIVSYKEDGSAYDMGRITIYPNQDVPAVGAFIEVRYMYCVVGGVLFQTTYLCERDDQDRSDCHMREIKFKAVVGDVEEE